MPVILVAEDDPAARAMIATALRADGHTVLTADDGLAALELARRHRLDLVVTDHRMPGRTGLQLADDLGRDPATAQIPVMMSSGVLDRDQAGASAYVLAAVLAKPVQPWVVRRVADILTRAG